MCEVWKHQHEAHWLLNNHKNLKLEKEKTKGFGVKMQSDGIY